MPEQPVPTVTAEDVDRVVRREYPAARIVEVMSILHGYGGDNWHHEPHRVRLAALKLAGGNMKHLRREIENARADYRDILAFAEYPNYMRHVPAAGSIPAEAEQQIINEDWRQYQAWLTRR